jgi:hypothetical protein
MIATRPPALASHDRRTDRPASSIAAASARDDRHHSIATGKTTNVPMASE